MVRKSSAGICSLTSALLTLLLSAVPLLLLNRVSNQFIQSRAASRHFDALIMLQQYLETISAAHASGAVPLYPRIHPAGGVTLSNGETLTLSKTASILPDRIGDAISWAQLDAGSMLRISSIERHGNTVQISACFALQSSAALPDTIKSFFVATRDGFFELVETQSHFAGQTSCHTLLLTIEESIMAQPAELFFAAGSTLLIPITRMNTLYRDISGTLRIVSHLGKTIQENQPVQDHFPIVRINDKTDRFAVHFLELTAQSTSTSIRPSLLRAPLILSPPGHLTLSVFLS